MEHARVQHTEAYIYMNIFAYIFRMMRKQTVQLKASQELHANQRINYHFFYNLFREPNFIET